MHCHKHYHKINFDTSNARACLYITQTPLLYVIAEKLYNSKSFSESALYGGIGALFLFGDVFAERIFRRIDTHNKTIDNKSIDNLVDT